MPAKTVISTCSLFALEEPDVQPPTSNQLPTPFSAPLPVTDIPVMAPPVAHANYTLNPPTARRITDVVSHLKRELNKRVAP